MAQKREINQRSDCGGRMLRVLMAWACRRFDGTGRNVKRSANMYVSKSVQCLPSLMAMTALSHAPKRRRIIILNYPMGKAHPPFPPHTHTHWERERERESGSPLRHICSPACENWLLLFIAAGYGQSFLSSSSRAASRRAPSCPVPFFISPTVVVAGAEKLKTMRIPLAALLRLEWTFLFCIIKKVLYSISIFFFAAGFTRGWSIFTFGSWLR